MRGMMSRGWTHRQQTEVHIAEDISESYFEDFDEGGHVFIDGSGAKYTSDHDGDGKVLLLMSAQG